MTDDGRYQNRRGAYAVLVSLNEIPLDGEIVKVKNVDEFRIGDGVTAFNDLTAWTPYVAPFQPYATVDRPNATAAATYFDTTLGIPGYSNGTDWVDGTGATI